MAKKAKAKEEVRRLDRTAGYILGIVEGFGVKRYWVDEPKNEARAKAWAPNAELPAKKA
jgi:hypothetical protein